MLCKWLECGKFFILSGILFYLGSTAIGQVWQVPFTRLWCQWITQMQTVNNPWALLWMHINPSAYFWSFISQIKICYLENPQRRYDIWLVHLVSWLAFMFVYVASISTEIKIKSFHRDLHLQRQLTMYFICNSKLNSKILFELCIWWHFACLSFR